MPQSINMSIILTYIDVGNLPQRNESIGPTGLGTLSNCHLRQLAVA
jgi:hypothetical protein